MRTSRIATPFTIRAWHLKICCSRRRRWVSFDVDKARVDLQIPAGFEPVAMVAVGYPGDLTRLPEYLQQRELKPRERSPVTEFVYAGLWDTPLVPSKP
jgi:hypothetical protein